MKKYLSIVAATAMAASAFAQGTINFQNTSGTVVKIADSSNPSGINLASPAYVQLFAAPGGTSFTPWGPTMSAAQFLTANPGFVFIGTPTAINPNAPGRFNGGAVTVTNATPGGPVEAAIVAWQGNFNSFDAAVVGQAIMGASPGIHFASTGNPLTTPIPGTPAPLTTGTVGGAPLGTFTIGAVPEPSSLALVGLGAAAMLVLRRRK